VWALKLLAAGSAAGAPVQDGQSFVGWRAFWRNFPPAAGPVTYVVCVG
jgi:hypothetical protein